MAAKKTIKRVVLVIVGIIIVVIIALGIFISTFDINKYKPTIEEKVSAAVGYNLKIDGDLGLAIFPSISVEVKNLHLENPEKFTAQAQDFVFVEKANVGLALMPLLSKRLEFKDIVLTGVNLNLVKPKDGAPNWDLNANKKQVNAVAANDNVSQAATEEAKSGDSHAKIVALLDSLSFNEIAVKNTKVMFYDLAGGNTHTFDNINFTCGPFDNADKPLKFDFSARMNNTPLSVKGQLTSISAILNGAIPFNVDATFDKLSAKVEGKFAAASDPMLEATVTLPAFSPKDLMKAVMPTVPDIIAKSGPNAFVKLETTQKITMSQKKVISFSGPFTFDQTSGNISGTFSSQDGAQNISLNLDANQIKVDNYLAAQTKSASSGAGAAGSGSGGGTAKASSGIPAPGDIFGKGALAKMNFTANIKLNQATFQNNSVTGLSATAKLNKGYVDASFSGKVTTDQVSGSVAGSYNSKNNIHNITVDADVPEVNLDTLMGGNKAAATTTASGAGGGSAAGSAGAAKAKKPILDAQTFGKLNIAAKVKLNKLIFKGLTFTGINVNAKVNQGATDAAFSASYGNAPLNGSFNGNLTAQSSQKALTFKTSGLPTATFLKAFMDKDLLTGALTADINVTGTGMDIDDFKRSMSGNVSATIGSGKINLGPAGIPFSSIQLNMAFANGKGDIKKGGMDGEVLAADLTGWINLSNDTLDVTLTPTKAMPVDAIASLIGLALPSGLTSGLSAKVPFRIHGPLSSPSLDWAQSIGAILQNLDLENLKQLDTKNIEENLKQGLQQGLQNQLDEALPGAGNLLDGLLNKKKDADNKATTPTDTGAATTTPAETTTPEQPGATETKKSPEDALKDAAKGAASQFLKGLGGK